MGGPGSGRSKRPIKPRELLKNVIPLNDLFNEEEINIYNSLIDIYIEDFDEDELTSADVDDVLGIATNKILEIRLLKTSRDNPDRQLDISKAVESLKKQTEKMKENLSARRRDRVDPNQYKGFSIVDLAVAFDQVKRSKLEEKARKLREEQDDSYLKLKNNPGNRYDTDVISKKEE